MSRVNELESQVLLEAHAKYTPQGAVNLLVENMADAISYRKDGVKNKTSDSISFELDTSEHFFDRGAFINWTSIPIEFVLNKVVPIGTYTDANCISILQSDICLREFGMMNAISSISSVIDGETVTTSSVDKMFKIVSPYYEKSALNYVVDSSMPDKFTTYSINDSAEWIPTVSTDNKNVIIRAPKLNPMNPFEPTVDPEYNSRGLVLSDLTCINDGTNITKISANLKNLTLFLPFNLFTTYNDETPIYNASKIKINIQLQSAWIKRIFSMKLTAAGAAPYDVRLQSGAFASNGVGEIEIHYRLYKPPTEVSNKIDFSKPYIRQYPIVELDSRTQDVVFKAGENQRSITSTPFDVRAIPKKVYICLNPKMETDDQLKTETNHFCRWDNLKVELYGTTTDIAAGQASEALYHISKENGLQMNKNEALYLRGFPICLDIPNNVAGNSNSLVGVNNNHSGKYTFRVSGQATRLHTGHTAFALTNFPTEASMRSVTEKTYEFNVIFVYSSYFVYNMFGKKFSMLESLSMDQLGVVDRNVNNLYEQFVPKMDVVGGSILTAIGPTVKSIGSGIFNVIKAAISNKNGFRDKLQEAYKGGGVFDGHAPLMGGGYAQSKISGGKSLLDYE